ncbi:MAG TPA: bifunctional UDP-sugar hydrolase/5'-nucleotidase [Candidatus Solibacter sp.]|nr:bifunctional UDP-sugar hydrolase/5'-nucleotidase [Candidatus Solibacter sp.]
MKRRAGRRRPRRTGTLACILLILSAGAAIRGVRGAQSGPAGAARVPLTLLARTDLHGHVFPLDEETGEPANLGLAKIATLVAQERAAHPHTLLFDCGDTTQGTALAYLAATRYAAQPNPVIAAMNAMGYDAMAVGNHDFNFGLSHLAKIRREARFPILGANVQTAADAPGNPFPAYVIRTVAGVRVGIIGVVTPGIARGEIPENYRGYRFRPIVEAVEQAAAELRPKVDLLVLLAHSGLGRDAAAASGTPPREENPENAMIDVATHVPGVDVILFGHTHQELGERFINGVLLAQAKFWGQSLAEAEIEMESTSANSWRVVSKHSRVIPVTTEVAADSGILKLDREIGDAAQEFLERPVAHVAAPLSGATARLEDSPLVDWIHQAQLASGHADVSIATMFRTGVRLPAGTLTVRNFFALYPYDNVLYTIEMTGAELRDALEYSASHYPARPPTRAAAGEERSLPLPSYEADSAAGVTYVLDLTKPAGSRVRDLAFRGRPLEPGQRLLVAVNHYRYYGDEKFRGRKIVRQVPEHVFEALVEYARRMKEMPTEAAGNWRIEPREAREALLRAAGRQ